MSFFPLSSPPSRTDRPAGARHLALLLLLFLLSAPVAFGQTTGDFRSRASGNWNKSNTWERYNGSTWVNSNNTPNGTAGTGVITIRTGHSVTGNASDTYDQIVIEAGGSLSISKDFGIQDGAGTDLNVFGVLDLSANMTFFGGATAIFHPGSVTSISNRKELQFTGTSQAVFHTGSQLTSSGTLTVADLAAVTVDPGVTYTNSGDITLTGDGQLTFNGSTLINSGTVSLSGTADLVFTAGSVYDHAQDGSALPAASNTTWSSGSTVLISGVTRNAPSNLDATFSNFIWDSSAQNRPVDLSGAIGGITGDFMINSTGSRELIWSGTTAANLSLGGDLLLNGGTLVIAEGTTSSVSVEGSATIAAGAALVLAEAGGTGTLQFGGNLTVDGTVSTAGGDLGTLESAGPGSHTLSISGSLTGDIDLLLSGPGSTTAQTDLVIPGHVTEVGGGLDMGGNALSLEGDLLISTALTNVAGISFTGAGDSSLSLPAGSNAIPSLTLDKTGGTVSLLSDVVVSTYVFIQGGSLAENGFALTLAEGATFFSDQPYAGSVTISRSYAHAESGWRMLASPVTNVSYSSLNNAFLTQGAPWATISGGSANLQAFNVGSQDWTPVTGADGVFSSGEGFILYAFAQDAQGSNILPTSWTVTGQPGAYAPQGLTFNTTPDDSWNFVGNPGTANMDWDLTVAASSSIGASYATWDPAVTSGGGTTGYKYYDATSGLGAAGRYIAPFTAYMVQATGAGATLQPSSSPAAAAQSANQFGKRTGKTPHFQLRVEGEQLAETETILSFGAEASDESDLFDVPRLAPLSAQFITLWSAVGDRRLAFDGRTMSGGQETYDIVVAGTRRGTYHIAADVVESIPAHWRARLIDLQTGNELDLLSGDSLRFQLSASDLVNGDRPMFAARSPRFRIVIQDTDRMVSGEPAGLPSADVPVLAQNFPNPFNPQTTIRFSLPESAPVRLEVYDMLGRRVALLVDRVMEAGWHDAQFDASHLSSGLYGYRLTVGSHAFGRSMLLLR
jgi:hypothetical protein